MNVTFDQLAGGARAALLARGAEARAADDGGWACAWLQACGYKGLAMLLEALDESTSAPALPVVLGGVDGEARSAVFFAPRLIEIARQRGRITYRNTRHGLFVLPFAVKANMAIGCPVDPAFPIGGEREGNPYEEKLAAAEREGIAVDDDAWARLAAFA